MWLIFKEGALLDGKEGTNGLNGTVCLCYFDFQNEERKRWIEVEKREPGYV